MQSPAGNRRQSGTVLIVVIVLLLLASTLTVFAVGVGVFEQRASSNDVRAKLVQQVADAALAQGSEEILANTDIFQLGTDWELCVSTDTTFPCGAAPADRRADMYRFIGGGVTTDVFGDGAGDAFDLRMLPMTRSVVTVNNSAAAATDGFPVQYGVGALWCRLAPAALGEAASCSTDPGANIRVNGVTLVAVAAMGGEGGRATAVKSFATNSTFALSADTPPIVASGPIELRGNLQLVGSPNGGGTGVPVSIWSRRPLDAGGTPDTCYADEFYRSGTPTWHPVGAPRSEQILRCDNCDCGEGPLTSGHGNTCIGGMDILAAPADCGTNQPVDPHQFPCDLFAHVFGVSSWRDVTGTLADGRRDNFCETKMTVSDPVTSGAQIGADEDYLATKADFIISDLVGFGARFASDARRVACGDLVAAVNARALDPGKGSLVWVRSGSCGSGLTLGTPKSPVLLVHDGAAHFTNIKLFGVLFVRSATAGPLDPATGGTATLRMAGNSVVYGSAIVQGQAEKVNGTAAIVYDAKVLGNLISGLDTPDVLGLPGSWSDSVRF